MIPTMFGVTIVSFCIMQLAPGDPVQAKLASSGSAGQSSQTREAYLIQKRDLKLDKPLLLNFNYFRDYAPPLAIAARFRAMTTDEMVEELKRIVDDPKRPANASALSLIRKLKISNLDRRLKPPELTAEQLAASGLTAEEWEKERQAIRRSLAEAIQGLLVPWCENVGIHGVPPAIEMLRDENVPAKLKVGVLRCLNSMVVSPFEYTYTRTADTESQQHVAATWKRLWEQERGKFPPLDPDRKAALTKRLKELAGLSRGEMFDAIQSPEFTADDVPFFVERILGDAPLAEKIVAAEFAKLYVSTRLQAEASMGGPQEELDRVIGNWVALYEASRSQYEFPLASKLIYVVADTQYTHMVWRLVTFRFGRSTLRTREFVSDRIWRAALVSVPLMLLAQILIYVVAVPLGVLSAAYRGEWVDRATVLTLFLLYSVPPFVAGMLFLLFFCFGDYLRLFPKTLHSPNAENIRSSDTRWIILARHVAGRLLVAFQSGWPGDVQPQRDAGGARSGLYSHRRAKGLPAPRLFQARAQQSDPFITLFANFLPALLGGAC
jgi:ABC-type dipeptide/oligopeptide/nickel transport system permease component